MAKKSSEEMTVAIQSPGEVQRFSRKELMQADYLKQYRDIAGAILEEGREYTLQEAVSKVDKFMKGKVR